MRTLILIAALAVVPSAHADVSDSGNLSIGANGVISGSMTVQGSVVSPASVTASAFFGDGSHLTGVTDNYLLGTGADGALDVVAGSTVNLTANETLPVYNISVATSVPLNIAVKNYTNLTIEAGGVMCVSTRVVTTTTTVQGIILHVQGTLTVNGTLASVFGTPNTNGQNPPYMAPWGAEFMYFTTPTLFPSMSTQTAGTASGFSLVASGGGGGATGSGVGGGGGLAASSGMIAALLNIPAKDWGASIFLTGSAGGEGTGGGAGGGHGGGFLYIFANQINVGSTGIIAAGIPGGTTPVPGGGSLNGGNGGTGGGGQGAGAGGGGGIIVLASPNPVVNLGTISANGGNGGAADNGAGGAGGSGGTNTTINGTPTSGASGTNGSGTGSGGGGGAGGIIINIGI